MRGDFDAETNGETTRTCVPYLFINMMAERFARMNLAVQENRPSTW